VYNITVSGRECLMSLDPCSAPRSAVPDASGRPEWDQVPADRLIGAATGVTMVRYNVPYPAAFELLLALGRLHGRDLEDIARQILLITAQAGDPGSVPGDRETPVPSVHETVGLRLLDLLCESTHPQQILDAITELAVEAIPHCDCASITLIKNGTPLTVAASDQRSRTVDESQYAGTAGPCLDAALTDDVVQVDDVSTRADEQKWAAVARDVGLTASVSLPIPASPEVVAALNIYSSRGPGWPTESIDAADILTAYAGDAIILAQRLAG
jgi:hypothetical protein